MVGWRLVVAGLCLSLSGCMTCIATETDGPRPFGGTRFFGSFTHGLFFARASVPLPADSRYASRATGLAGIGVLFWPLLLIDFPLSFAADVVLLPISIPCALLDDSDDPAVPYEEGREALEAGRWDDAIQHFGMAIDRDPDNAVDYGGWGTILSLATKARGDAWRQRGDRRNAARDYERALQLGYDDALQLEDMRDYIREQLGREPAAASDR